MNNENVKTGIIILYKLIPLAFSAIISPSLERRLKASIEAVNVETGIVMTKKEGRIKMISSKIIKMLYLCLLTNRLAAVSDSLKGQR